MPDTGSIEVFISYSHADTHEVEKLIEVLKSHGLGVVWDQEVKIREKWIPKLREDLTRTDVVICCWSDTSSQSGWVMYEAGWADSHNKLINLILTEGARPHESTADFQGAQWFDWNGPDGAAKKTQFCNTVKELAVSLRKPATARSENLVTRLDRTPQINQLDGDLRAALDHSRASMIWLLPAHAREYPEDFVRRVGVFRLPDVLESKPALKKIVEAYEPTIYTIDWPVGYRNEPQALESIARQLAEKVAVANPDDGPASFDSALAECEALFPLIDIKVPLQHWQPADAGVLRKVLRHFLDVRLDGARSRFCGVFVSARFNRESERNLAMPGSGLLGKLFKRKAMVDDFFADLAADLGVFCMPALPKIGFGEVQEWQDYCFEKAGIPDQNQFAFRDAIYKPFKDRGDDEALHYADLAGDLERALRDAVTLTRYAR